MPRRLCRLHTPLPLVQLVFGAFFFFRAQYFVRRAQASSSARQSAEPLLFGRPVAVFIRPNDRSVRRSSACFWPCHTAAVPPICVSSSTHTGVPLLPMYEVPDDRHPLVVRAIFRVFPLAAPGDDVRQARRDACIRCKEIAMGGVAFFCPGCGRQVDSCRSGLVDVLMCSILFRAVLLAVCMPTRLRVGYRCLLTLSREF